MSRCFPYPPPGYSLSSARNEALIESIKLQKEKERKKEKKEKRKENKKEKRNEKEKRKDEKKPNLDKSDIPKHYIGDKSDIPKHHMTQNGPTDTKVEFLHKKREVETEQLDQSSLTEEHACPSSLPFPSSSSESTEKSKKRKRNSSPRDDTPVHGKVILIRLPSMKQNEFDAISNDQQQPCLNSERSDLLDGSRDVNCMRDGTTKFLNRKSNITADNTEKICSTSLQIDTGKIGINYKPMLPKTTVFTPMQKLELQYTNLLEDCLPPPIQDGCVLPTDDLDWLLVGRNQETRAEKTPRFGSESLSCSRSWGLWPRAHYLPEVDLYALPFTVPY